jgi:hypothetical protein
VGGAGGGSYTEDDHPEDREALRKYYVKLLTLAGYKCGAAHYIYIERERERKQDATSSCSPSPDTSAARPAAKASLER